MFCEIKSGAPPASTHLWACQPHDVGDNSRWPRTKGSHISSPKTATSCGQYAQKTASNEGAIQQTTEIRLYR